MVSRLSVMSCSVFVLAALLLVSGSEPGSCEAELDGALEPYDLLFDTAVEAYYKRDWLSVILNMERALRNKGTVRRVKAECRLACANLTAFQRSEPGSPVPLPGAGPVQDLGFFQRVLKRAECVNRCEAEKLGPPSVHKVSDEVELEFRKRTPYNYLQVAYFKVNIIHFPHRQRTAGPSTAQNTPQANPQQEQICDIYNIGIISQHKHV